MKKKKDFNKPFCEITIKESKQFDKKLIDKISNATADTIRLLFTKYGKMNVSVKDGMAKKKKRF